MKTITKVAKGQNVRLSVKRGHASLPVIGQVKHVDAFGIATVVGLDGQLYCARDYLRAEALAGVKITRIL